jgi:hypothetical protein
MLFVGAFEIFMYVIRQRGVALFGKLFSLPVGLRSIVETPHKARLHLTKSYILETSALGNFSFVIAIIPNRSLVYAIALLPTRGLPSFFNSGFSSSNDHYRR